MVTRREKYNNRASHAYGSEIAFILQIYYVWWPFTPFLTTIPANKP